MRRCLIDRRNADLLLAGRVTHPRPDHLTEYLRRNRAGRLRLGDWLPVALVAAALAVCLALYALPNVFGWLEGGL